MSGWAGLVVPFLLLGLSSQAADLKGIKGADDRVEVDVRQHPWSAVARFNNGHGGHCSGVLVAPDVAVTAAHCLWNKKTRRPMPLDSLHFVTGYDRGSYTAHALVTRTVVSPEWRFDAPYSPTLAAHDWAVLVLDARLGDQVGVVPVGAPAGPGDTLVTVGYGQDKAHIATAHRGCHVVGRLASGVLTHDCDAVHGDSGGPVMSVTGDGVVLAAIHVATFTLADGRVLGGAVPSSAFAAAVRAATVKVEPVKVETGR